MHNVQSFRVLLLFSISRIREKLMLRNPWEQIEFVHYVMSDIIHPSIIECCFDVLIFSVVTVIEIGTEPADF